MPVTTLLPNEANPYYTIFEAFLKRQAVISGTLTIINESTLPQFSSNTPAFNSTTGTLIVTDNVFKFDSKDPDDVMAHKSYILMTIIAQMFENLEHFIRENVRCHIDHLIPQEKANDIISRNTIRSNSDAIQILHSIAPQIAESLTRKLPYHNIDLNDWFPLIENVRHCVVHRDQIPSPKLNALIKKHQHIFDAYFTIEPKTKRIMTELHRAQHAITASSTYAFAILEGMCISQGYKIEQKTITLSL